MNLIFRILFIYLPLNISVSLFTVAYIGNKQLDIIYSSITRAYELGCYLGVALSNNHDLNLSHQYNIKCYLYTQEFDKMINSEK